MPVTNHAAPAARRAFAGRQLGNSSARVARKTKRMADGRTKNTRNKHCVGQGTSKVSLLTNTGDCVHDIDLLGPFHFDHRDRARRLQQDMSSTCAYSFLGNLFSLSQQRTLSCRDKTQKNAQKQEQTGKGNQKHSNKQCVPPRALEGLQTTSKAPGVF